MCEDVNKYISIVYDNNAVHLLGFNFPCFTFTFFMLVLSRIEQLPSATQAAAHRHSSSKQLGGALPSAQLLDS